MPGPPDAHLTPEPLRAVVFDDLFAERGLDGDVPDHVELTVLDHADDAVAVVQRQRPHLVLMDYEMNGLVTGDRAVRALREAFPRAALRIVAISASTSANQLMLAEGADGVVSKGEVLAFLSRQGRAHAAAFRARSDGG